MVKFGIWIVVLARFENAMGIEVAKLFKPKESSGVVFATAKTHETRRV